MISNGCTNSFPVTQVFFFCQIEREINFHDTAFHFNFVQIVYVCTFLGAHIDFKDKSKNISIKSFLK